MPRVTTSGTVALGSDATYRAALAEYDALLADCGLVRTSDTGQYDTSSITWPASNNTDSPTYSIWRFNDSLQATAPIFIKFQPGRGNNTTFARGTISVGTGTDGAGNLTGVLSGANMVQAGALGASTYSSYAVHREGLAAVAFKVQSAGANNMPWSFIVQRTVDNNGNPTGEGAQVLRPASSTTALPTCRLRFSPTTQTTGFVASSTLALGLIPGAITDGRVGLSPQVFPHWIALPKQKPLIGTAASVRGEIALGQQFSMTLVGASPRNYLCLGSEFGNSLLGSTNSDLMLLWED